jgi:hypothetical protein
VNDERQQMIRIQSLSNIFFLKLASIFLLFFANTELRSIYAQEYEHITQNFDQDPGWEGVNNRVVCNDCPDIEQNFGWTSTNHNGDGTGEISGTIWRSTTPAYYAMPLGPLSFKDKFSASGKLSLIAPEKEGVGFYIGFFNAERQGWRVWSSCGFRMSPVKQNHARFHLDYKTGKNKGAILNPDIVIPCDGSVHTWELSYEPDALIKDSWPDPRLPEMIGPKSNTHEDEIFERTQKLDPQMTREQLHDLLLKARDAGLVDHWYRKGQYHLWEIERTADKMKGRITFKFDDYAPVSYFLMAGHADEETIINRFGVYNMQIYNGSMHFFLSDLVVNGEKIDLSQDPHWQGMGNRVSFVQDDFHSRQNFGYSQTNWAGASGGEIGGRFWGTEVPDPLHGFYADDIGTLTLEDPISFSGSINFTEGAVDGRMLFGYFNRDAKMAAVTGEYKGNPPNQFLGIEVMDQTQIGYSFTAVCSPGQDISFEIRGPIFIPDRIKRQFMFTYEPDSGKAGRIEITLDSHKFSADLTKEQRKFGASFDRFGLLNPRKGGKYVDVYLDDLTYVVRRPEDTAPEKFRQEIIRVPYPPDGRLYK